MLYSKVIEKNMFPGNQSATFTYCAQVIRRWSRLVATSRYCMQEQFYTRAGKQMKVVVSEPFADMFGINILLIGKHVNKVSSLC